MNHITWNHLEVAKGFTLPKSGLWLPIALLHFPRVSIVECGLLPLYSRPTLVVATFTPGSNSWRVKLLSASGGSMLCEKHRVERPIVHMSVINTGTLSPVWFNSHKPEHGLDIVNCTFLLRECEQRSKLDQVYCAWLIKWWVISGTLWYCLILGGTWSAKGLYACIYCKKWRFGRVTPMPHTLTDIRI